MHEEQHESVNVSLHSFLFYMPLYTILYAIYKKSIVFFLGSSNINAVISETTVG